MQMMPDARLAVDENEPKLASELFAAAHTWVVDVQSVAKDLQPLSDSIKSTVEVRV